MDFKTFDRSLFEPLKPNLLSSKVLSFSAMADHTVRLNTRLNQTMMADTGRRFLRLSLWPEGRQVLLEPFSDENEDTVFVPKLGAFSMHSLGKALEAEGIKLPAYFVVEQLPGETAWIGEYGPEHRFPAQTMSPERMKKPRKSGLASMLPKEDAR